MDNDLMEVMQPYLTSRFEQDHLRDVSSYHEHFETSQQGTKHEEEVFGQPFVRAFRQEFGLSPARLAEVSTVLMEDAISAKSTVTGAFPRSTRSLLITSKLVPMQFVSTFPVEIVSADQLTGIL
jgi:hypothetical protein